MKTRYIDDEELDQEPRDREISLGATTILGIFFLLALVCAVFFGFGYSIGKKSTVAVGSTTTDAVEASSIKTTGAAKPSPGVAPAETATTSADDVPDMTSQTTSQPEQVAVVSAPPPAPTKKSASTKPVAPPPAPASSKAAAPVPAPIPASHSAASGPAGAPALVQIAAVSHQEDADTLLNALKRRGYNVSVRHEPQDKLLHVQIGPLPTRKDADAMRQRLLADGYNAIVK